MLTDPSSVSVRFRIRCLLHKAGGDDDKDKDEDDSDGWAEEFLEEEDEAEGEEKEEGEEEGQKGPSTARVKDVNRTINVGTFGLPRDDVSALEIGALQHPLGPSEPTAYENKVFF